MATPLTPAQIAKRFGCTETQLRAQYRKGAESLRRQADRAEKNPSGKCGGYTAAELRVDAEKQDLLGKEPE